MNRIGRNVSVFKVDSNNIELFNNVFGLVEKFKRHSVYSHRIEFMYRDFVQEPRRAFEKNRGTPGIIALTIKMRTRREFFKKNIWAPYKISVHKL